MCFADVHGIQGWSRHECRKLMKWSLHKTFSVVLCNLFHRRTVTSAIIMACVLDRVSSCEQTCMTGSAVSVDVNFSTSILSFPQRRPLLQFATSLVRSTQHCQSEELLLARCPHTLLPNLSSCVPHASSSNQAEYEGTWAG